MSVCADTTVPGIDVSRYQYNTDWSAVAASGKAFAFVKYSEGTGYTSNVFAADWAAAKLAGLLRGAYHFAHFDVDGASQAAYFLQHAAKYGSGELPPVIDVETGTTQPITDMNVIGKVVSDWIDAVTAATGKRPLVYVSSGFWRVPASYGIESKADLWVAQYPGTQPAATGPWCPNVTGAWTAWKFWQHSDKGVVPGVQKPCDVDVFNGSLADLQAYAGQGAAAILQAPAAAVRQVQAQVAAWPAAAKWGIVAGAAVLLGVLAFVAFSED